MRLTVLGSSASYADAGRACSGYLVEAGGTRVMLDCGHGALANLARVADPLTLDGLFVSHVHPDHVVDVYALQALLRYSPQGPAPALPLWGPPGLLERMGCLLSDRGTGELAEAFEAGVLEDGARVALDALEVSAHRVEHSDHSFALGVSGPDGASLLYTGDSASSPELVLAAEGADVLLAEATLPQAYSGRAPHMTAAQAAAVAARAGARKLVLTHVWPTTDRDAILEEARAVFAGEVLVAEELMEIAVA